ncbi:peroxiredoxin [Occultella glacieicola]|uniref:Peroxiredoxin n=1 Tax=Occultella glacieicola TaxID=2518684 RepID=A0ABY2DZA5_9MICO|nr:peroxiredoxin [Occultella glacieicola]TDE90015.1 peroxiredoxin [Occultella glacieicola]
MTNVPEPGDLAPDFTAEDTHGTPVSLSALRGTPVALVFFPFAFSGICTGELCELRDNLSSFERAGVRLLGISCDSKFALRAWGEQERFGFDLISDFWPHGQIARSYGVFDSGSGLALRGSLLLDADGVVRWSVLNPRGQARPLAAYLQALDDLAA